MIGTSYSTHVPVLSYPFLPSLTVLATNAASTSETVTPREAHCLTILRTSS